MPTRRSYLQLAASVALVAALVASVPALAGATVRAACDPFTGSVDSLAAAPLDGGATLTWDAAGGTVRIIRSGSGYVMDPAAATGTTGLGVLCWNSAATIVYEGNASTFADSGMENGYRYYYTAFLWDAGTSAWLAPSGTTVIPKTNADLSKPAVPSYVADHHTFAVSGSLGYAHPFKTSVQLVFFKSVGGSWKYLKSGTYSVASGHKGYRISVVLPSDGSIKLVAKHADRDHYRSASPARFFYSH